MSILSDVGKTFTDLGKKYSKAAKPIVDAVPGIKWMGQSATNLWTGVKLTKPAAAIGITGLALYSVGSGAYNAASYKKTQVTANGEQVGMLPAMNYVQHSGGRNLGATGDLVFGLHNMRRG